MTDTTEIIKIRPQDITAVSIADLSDRVIDGDLPPLANGFAFEINSRPQGQEHEKIPVAEFTGAFARGRVPVAHPKDHMHLHDVGHMATYQEMFRYQEFADLVRETAPYALTSEALTIEFGDAIDELGEAIEVFGGEPSVSVFADARRHLRRLIDLRQPRAGQAAADLKKQNEELFNTLHDKLGITRYQERVRAMPARRIPNGPPPPYPGRKA